MFGPKMTAEQKMIRALLAVVIFVVVLIVAVAMLISGRERTITVSLISMAGVLAPAASPAMKEAAD